MQLQGRRVVITGASAGIGAAMARSFAAAGAQVVVAARRLDKLEALAAEIGGAAMAVDLTDEAQVDDFVPRVEAAHGPTDIFVNNAGIETIDSAAVIDPAELRQVTRLNLETPMVLTRHVLPGMLARGGGHLVYTSSLAATSAYPSIGPYCATKAGLTNFASAVRSEVKRHGVGVTIVAPGPVDTDMWDQVEQSSPSGQRVVRRMQRLQLIPKISADDLAAQVTDAVANDKRHVRHPKRMLANFWLNEAPRRLAEAVLVGVRYDPLERATGTPRAAGATPPVNPGS